MKAPVVVKLGGSAITDKSKASTARLEVIHNATKEIASYSGPMVLLHGGGSFAHPFGSKAALRTGFRQKSKLASIPKIELNRDQLTRIIGIGLLLRRRPSVTLKPRKGDVTGGMRGKALEAIWLAKRGSESYIFNLTKSGNLRSLLEGSSSIGTRFLPWRKTNQ